jgi:Fe-S cluster assembly iron-binding protein IscA
MKIDLADSGPARERPTVPDADKAGALAIISIRTCASRIPLSNAFIRGWWTNGAASGSHCCAAPGGSVRLSRQTNHKEDSMVRVTERAATALQEFLATNDAPPDSGVRLAPDSRGDLGMIVDAPHAGDEVVVRGEDAAPVLIVDSAVADELQDMVVDYEVAEDDHQTAGGFVLRMSQGQG